MTEEEKVVYTIRGIIAGLSEEEQLSVEAAEKEIRATLLKYSLVGMLAVALVGAEVVAGMEHIK